MKRSIVSASILALGLVGAGFIATAAANPPGHGGMEYGDHGHYAAPFHSQRAFGKHLDLSDTQRKQISEIFKAQASERGDKLEALGQIRKDLWGQAFSDSFDPANARILAERQADLLIEMQVGQITALNQAYQVLDADQKKELTDRQAKRQERWKEHKDGERSHRHGHDSN